MAEIKLLDEVLINQIAAGEVVERPANAIKELVENSIDAGAKNICVEIEEAGKKLISVIDDGKGIMKDDLELAISRHATSKIREEKDLWSIYTLGFRGEALSSIASVSKMSIKSKRIGTDIAYELNTEGGELKNMQEISMNTGTIICVREIFFNTPARKKFLKSDSNEVSNISALLYSIALSYPQIAFKLIHNSKTVFDLNSVSNFKSRIIDIYGKNIEESLIPVFYDGVELKINGFIGKPSISRSNTKHQFFFVNGRFIRNSGLSALLKQAYRSMLMEHKNPVFFINIEIPPAQIDVNIHPKKTEIRFFNQSEVQKIVYRMVKNALEKNDLSPRGLINDMSMKNKEGFGEMARRDEVGGASGNRFDAVNFDESLDKGREAKDSFANGLNANDSRALVSYNNESRRFDSFANRSNPNINGAFNSQVKANNFEKSNVQGKSKSDALDFSKKFLQSEFFEREKGDFREGSLKVLTQLNNAYIIAEDSGELVLIDQHAGHERVRYEELMDQYENHKKEIQNLLIPEQIELRGDEKVLIEENLDIFEKLGFEIENFGGNSFNVYGVPKFLVNENIEEIIKGVLDDIINDKEASKLQGKSEAMITYMACRSAIKFGQKLGVDEMYALVKQMKELKRPYTCPHGRPTMVNLDMKSLEKMFGRS
jgi:DNA mismatch repair protein MutL